MRNQLSLFVLLSFFVVFSQARADEPIKEQLILMPVVGVDMMVKDILDQYGSPAEKDEATAKPDDSFAIFKKKQKEEFEAFKRGSPSPEQIVERERADQKALTDRIAEVENRLQTSFQWALRESLQNHYQVLTGRDYPDAQLVATGSISKRGYGYLLELSIKDASGKVTYYNSLPCQDCNEIQVGIKFKDLGNVQLPSAEVPPSAVIETPPSKTTPQSPPVDTGTDNCYADEFVQVCIIKAESGKNRLPKLKFALKNLTDDKIFIATANQEIRIKDDDGNSCLNAPDGINNASFSVSEGDYRLVPPKNSFNFYWNWGCQNKATGNELLSSMRLERLSNGKRFEFDVEMQSSGWNKNSK